MKSIAVLTLGLIAGASLAAAQETTKQAKIDRILALTNADAVMDQMYTQIKAMTASMTPAGATPKQQATAREIQDKVIDLVKTRMGWDKLRVQYAKVYDTIFSESEIDGLLAFYESPAGQAMVKKMPQLISQTMTVVQTQMADIMPEIQRIAKEAAQK